MIVLNGDIWTGDKENPYAQALAIDGDKIIHVGKNEEVMELFKDKSEVKIIDAKNMFITPGFIDSHIHFLLGGERLNSVKLKDAKTKEEFINRIAEHAKKLPKGHWITGGDWDHIHWGGELPERLWIDNVTQDNPVWIGRHEGHTYLANTLAMKIAGIYDENSNKFNVEDVEGGTIVKDNYGLPTGVFKDNAIKIVFTKIPFPSYEENKTYIESSMNYVIKHGVTSIHHMTEPCDRNRGGDARDLEFYEAYDKEDKLRTRIYTAVPIENRQKLVEKIKNNQNNSKMLSFGALKGYIDGSIGSHSAAFFDDYKDCCGYKGTFVNTTDDLFNWIKEADSNNLQIFIHAIGDRGIHEILNVFEKVIQVNGQKDRRWRIEHSQHIHPSDIKRFKDLGVVASVQPFHLIEDGRFLNEYIGEERLKGTYAFRSLIDAGVLVAFGSDWFVAPPEPLKTIDAAVNRIVDGQVFMPEERVTVEEALLGCTLWAAQSVHEEKIKGTLTNGKLADFVIMDKNILKIDPLSISETNVVMTVLGGNILYDKDH
jgi:predicted amidohydrolase YtcJ